MLEVFFARYGVAPCTQAPTADKPVVLNGRGELMPDAVRASHGPMLSQAEGEERIRRGR